MPIAHPSTETLGRALTLSDAGAISAALEIGPFAPAEYSFANLWLFRNRHDYRLVEDGLPHIRGITYDGEVHALPLEKPSGDNFRALLSTGVDCIFPVGDAVSQLVEELGLRCDHRDADSDYWYDAAAMAQLSGAKARRSQARQFETTLAPEFEDWSDHCVTEALQVLEGWSEDVGRPADRTDIAECREALDLTGELGLEGCLVKVSGEAVAFLLSSGTRDTRIVHFAKGRRQYSAAYPWMFSQYAGRSGAQWINFEQDLGNPGLAQSKRAYVPAKRQSKWRLRI
ncbi:DUF2156 domain-containing protein [Erythrobacter litoralis]|uniref:phosphatidylglycerol lysyltransferase domain-containing protein n=1 Tax=Erythrobacter litoralis TaxID=39960 RepID=UPI002435D215|nr:phosphatidylglycerol lysyltransferase domain-containing protein [Erythrobacter litoralis]MDG6079840.1 DUF2156 domain-containing protein [Erythrobacter litoralis]